MAGQRQMQISDVPARRGYVVSIPFTDPSALSSLPLMICERDTVVDDVRFRWNVASTVADDSVLVILMKAASGTAIASGTALTDGLSVATTADTNAVGVFTKSFNVPNQNEVAAGSTLGVKFVLNSDGTTAQAPTELLGFVVTLRLRDRM